MDYDFTEQNTEAVSNLSLAVNLDGWFVYLIIGLAAIAFFSRSVKLF